MAKFGAAVTEVQELTKLMQDLADLPQEVQDEMLLAEAAIVYRAQHTAALKDLDEKGYSTGATAAALAIGKPMGQQSRHLFLQFEGSRGEEGKSLRYNSTVAFFNEVGSRHIRARRWIQKANEQSADEAVQAAAKVYDKWLGKSR